MKGNKLKALKYMGQLGRHDLEGKIVSLLTMSVSANIRDGFHKAFGILI